MQHSLRSLHGKTAVAIAFDFEHAFVTLYSAVYRPAEGVVDYFWPGHRWRQGFADFRPGRYTHRYAAS